MYIIDIEHGGGGGGGGGGGRGRGRRCLPEKIRLAVTKPATLSSLKRSTDFRNLQTRTLANSNSTIVVIQIASLPLGLVHKVQ